MGRTTTSSSARRRFGLLPAVVCVALLVPACSSSSDNTGTTGAADAVDGTTAPSADQSATTSSGENTASLADFDVPLSPVAFETFEGTVDLASVTVSIPATATSTGPITITPGSLDDFTSVIPTIPVGPAFTVTGNVTATDELLQVRVQTSLTQGVALIRHRSDTGVDALYPARLRSDGLVEAFVPSFSTLQVSTIEQVFGDTYPTDCGTTPTSTMVTTWGRSGIVDICTRRSTRAGITEIYLTNTTRLGVYVPLTSNMRVARPASVDSTINFAVGMMYSAFGMVQLGPGDTVIIEALPFTSGGWEVTPVQRDAIGTGLSISMDIFRAVGPIPSRFLDVAESVDEAFTAIANASRDGSTFLEAAEAALDTGLLAPDSVNPNRQVAAFVGCVVDVARRDSSGTVNRAVRLTEGMLCLAELSPVPEFTEAVGRVEAALSAAVTGLGALATLLTNPPTSEPYLKVSRTTAAVFRTGGLLGTAELRHVEAAIQFFEEPPATDLCPIRAGSFWFSSIVASDRQRCADATNLDVATRDQIVWLLQTPPRRGECSWSESGGTRTADGLWFGSGPAVSVRGGANPPGDRDWDAVYNSRRPSGDRQISREELSLMRSWEQRTRGWTACIDDTGVLRQVTNPSPAPPPASTTSTTTTTTTTTPPAATGPLTSRPWVAGAAGTRIGDEASIAAEVTSWGGVIVCQSVPVTGLDAAGYSILMVMPVDDDPLFEWQIVVACDVSPDRELEIEVLTLGRRVPGGNLEALAFSPLLEPTGFPSLSRTPDAVIPAINAGGATVVLRSDVSGPIAGGALDGRLDWSLELYPTGDAVFTEQRFSVPTVVLLQRMLDF